MMANNLCGHCNCDLTKLDEVHSVEGVLYCSEECAVASQVEVIIASAEDTAREWYNESAEIVSTKDIGLVYEKKWEAYSKELDVTTIFVSKYLDKECEEAISTEVVGFYWGEPNEQDTESYTGELKAVY